MKSEYISVITSVSVTLFTLLVIPSLYIGAFRALQMAKTIAFALPYLTLLEFVGASVTSVAVASLGVIRVLIVSTSVAFILLASGLPASLIHR